MVKMYCNYREFCGFPAAWHDARGVNLNRILHQFKRSQEGASSIWDKHQRSLRQHLFDSSKVQARNFFHFFLFFQFFHFFYFFHSFHSFISFSSLVHVCYGATEWGANQGDGIIWFPQWDPVSDRLSDTTWILQDISRLKTRLIVQ